MRMGKGEQTIFEGLIYKRVKDLKDCLKVFISGEENILAASILAKNFKSNNNHTVLIVKIESNSFPTKSPSVLQFVNLRESVALNSDGGDINW
jgi:hypothetical protein